MSNDTLDLGLGTVTTPGDSFRARAERRQREYRAAKGWGWEKTGHWLEAKAEAAGKNFVVDCAKEEALSRQKTAKGVAQRTFKNMLASQAMCFNLFAPLKRDPALAGRVLGRVFPGLVEVTDIDFEHTPDPDAFGDQSKVGGVDCDLRIDGRWAGGAKALVTVETKFVEPDFSTCGYRKAASPRPKPGDGKKKRERETCDSYSIRDPTSECLYVKNWGYRYWDLTKHHGTLQALPTAGCPFSGVEWQLWLNHVLAHELASREHARPLFAVCAPSGNRALLGPEPKGDEAEWGGPFLASFAARLADRSTFRFISLERVLEAITAESGMEEGERQGWAAELVARYGGL